MPKQIQIVQIENGWIVTSMESVGNVIDQQGNHQPQVKQVPFFCANYEEVCERLKELLVLV